jgi:hypothetical protein
MFIRAHHPPKISFKFLRIREEGCLWITEYVITYDGYPVNTVTIMEFRDGKVPHETHYFADPFEPPLWRSQWVERFELPMGVQKEWTLQTKELFK